MMDKQREVIMHTLRVAAKKEAKQTLDSEADDDDDGTGDGFALSARERKTRAQNRRRAGRDAPPDRCLFLRFVVLPSWPLAR